MKEADIEKRLRVAVEAAGGYCLKMPAQLYRGIPDRLVLLPGARIFFVELKKPGAPTMATTKIHQSKWKKKLMLLGLNSYLIQTIIDLERLIHEQVENQL